MESYEEAVDVEGFLFVYQGCGLFQVTCWMSDKEFVKKRRELNQRYFKETSKELSSSHCLARRSLENIHGMFECFVPLERCDVSRSLDSGLDLHRKQQDVPKNGNQPVSSNSDLSQDPPRKRRRFYCSVVPCVKHKVCFSLQKELNAQHTDVYQTRFCCMARRCSASYSSLSALKKHQLLHNDDISKRFICETCGRTFPFCSELAYHEKCHSDAHPFKCSQCSQEYKLKSDLTRYEQMHTGSVISCLYPEYHYSTKNKRNLYKHVRGKHHGALYKCPKRGCDFSSSFRSGVRYHLVSGHNEKKKFQLKNKKK